jgi:hypothetical protein
MRRLSRRDRQASDLELGIAAFEIAPVAVPRGIGPGGMANRVGALGHATFGGRLAADAKGFPARAMAKKRAGDWRDPAQIGAWAADIARALPFARPGARSRNQAARRRGSWRTAWLAGRCARP